MFTLLNDFYFAVCSDFDGKIILYGREKKFEIHCIGKFGLWK